MSRSPFRVLVADLIGQAGRRRPLEIEARVDWALELVRVDPQAPVAADLLLEGASGGVLMRGTVHAAALQTCRRCLAEWAEPIEVDVFEMLGTDPDAEYPLVGEEANLEVPLRDAVLLAFPLRPLCRPDCRGLCGVCGGNLNTGSCPGHGASPDSPFSALRELLGP